MYLEKLDIQGFKSFAHPTTLVFNKELTAVVGPNGSGKSNIADAIRWVLGEQSMKLLRGKKSDDVIFAGSDTKSRLGFAKVILYLQNLDRKADIDYDQVVIERSVDRNGESEYLINGSKVRLTDVQLLLARASVGQKSYSVIGQGMIDNLLVLSAQDRRDFFDEATGVRQYQLKKSQALNKLDQTDDNLEQAELVLQEIEPRLRTLTRQVRRLERREDLEKQLVALQNEYYSYLLGILNHDLGKARDKREKEDQHLQKITSEQKIIQSQLDEHDRAQGRGEAYNTLQKKLFNAQQEYNALTKKKVVLEGQKDLGLIKQGAVSQAVLGQRLIELKNKKNTLSTTLHEREQEITRGTELVEQLEARVAESTKKLERLERELTSPAGADQKTLQAMADDLHKEHEAISAHLEQVGSANDISSFKDRFKKFTEKFKNFLNNIRAIQRDERETQLKAFSRLNQEHKSLDQELRSAELILGRKEHERSVIQEQIEDIEKELHDVERQLEKNAPQHAVEDDIQYLETELAQKETAISELRNEIDTFNEREENKKKNLVDLQKKFRTLQYDYTVKNNELTNLKIEFAKLETKKEELEKEIAQEAPRFEFNTVKQLHADEARERIETTKRQLNIIGGIDTETIKEYEEVKEKHEFLSQQTTDLRGAQKSLIKLITELDEHITKQFQLSFKNINSLFTKYFKQLFDGGRAKLTLNILKEKPEDTEIEDTDESEEDVPESKKKEKSPIKKLKAKHLDYTIDITATPPGKKLSGINMLSGGEKALTAIALICSIIANNPPPFVVLDEVDAALDEANSIRFADIISELLDKSQFITITHNRATMHQAKILYGVTMGDDGISKLLSVNFDQADKLSV